MKEGAKMRKGNKKLNFIIILMICFSLSLSTVQAYAFYYTSLDIKNAGGRGEGLCILEFASGTLGEDEEVVYEIDVPFDGILRIDRVYDREQGFYGRYDVRIDELDFEHTFFNDTLEEGSRAVYDVAKGTYSLKVSTYKAYAGYCISVKVYPTSDVPATGMFLPAYDGTLAVGDSMQLLCAPEPEYSTDTIIWKSSNKKIATVDENGIVTATGLGTATITAQSKETGVKDTCKIKVRKMNYNMWTSEKKASLQKYVKHLKNYEKGKWSSSKTSVIKVSNTGKLTPIKSGTATVKFKCDGHTS